jgi:hypothetical protein
MLQLARSWASRQMNALRVFEASTGFEYLPASWRTSHKVVISTTARRACPALEWSRLEQA